MSGLCQQIDPAMWSELLKNIDTVIFDADGVLWWGMDAILGSPELIEQVAAMVIGMACTLRLFNDDIVSPPAICVEVLQQMELTKPKVYVIGYQGLKDELGLSGFQYIGDGPDHFENYSETEFLYDVPLDPEVGAVIVGYDSHFNYVKLMKAANYLRDPKCLFITNNDDSTFRKPNQKFTIPKTAAIVVAVTTVVQREPLVVGKPHITTYNYIRAHWNIDPKRTLIVGDRCNTDIKFGVDHGMKTMLVLSGVHTLADVDKFRKEDRKDFLPDFYAGKLGDLL
uniref:Phosphoglycolate phosphatase n=1 Tax=Plectus sambesii TaxID=2011161 RepID=A0A914VFB8_9BILA